MNIVEPTPYQKAILGALQLKPRDSVYQGLNLDHDAFAQFRVNRRKRNKVAKASRRINRQRA